MTERERILSILNHKKPDKLPWCADLDYWIGYLRAEKIYPKKYENTYYNNGLQKMHRDFGAGFYLQGHFPFNTHYELEVITKTENSKNIRIFKTPYGDLTEITQFSNASYSTPIVEYLIKGIDDLKKLRYVYENTYYTKNYDLAEHEYETIGSNGVVLCYMPKSPMMELVALLSGIETFTYMFADDEEELSHTLSVMEEKCDQACEIVLNSPAECIMIPENISSESVGKTFYHMYMEQYHKKWTKRIKEKGKYSFVHLDGTVRGLITELSKSGFDVIEAVTPKPVGDVEIDEVLSLVEENTIIWGGIPGGFFTNYISDEEFDKHVIHCIKVMTKTPRFVLGVADQIVPTSSVKRIKRVRELVDLYGNY